MYFRTFFFLLFILTSIIFFLSSLSPNLILNLCGSFCEDECSLNYIQLTSLIASAISIVLYVISSYFSAKYLRLEQERFETERLNIERIHNELEALKE
jgi:uncharacterized membrane protein